MSIQPTFESLETRRLLSSSVIDGQLRIVSDDNAQHIEVSRVTINGGQYYQVIERPIGHVRTLMTHYPVAGVTSVYIDAKGGDDRLIIDPGVTLPATLKGGAGNDTLTGGGGNDDIVGGSGRDLLDYATRTANLVITLDAARNDTGAGGTDNVRSDVEHVTGGSGHDAITGTSDRNVLRGGGGNDTLRGLGGNDQLFGDAGNDRMFGGTGADRFFGGDGGLDTVDYANRTVDLSVTFDDFANDGSAGEGDGIDAGVEVVVGGAGDDTFRGGAANNRFYGNAGNDQLLGGAGHDYLDGGAGNDSLHGGFGADTMVGGGGSDRLDAALDRARDTLYVTAPGDTWTADVFDDVHVQRLFRPVVVIDELLA